MEKILDKLIQRLPHRKYGQLLITIIIIFFTYPFLKRSSTYFPIFDILFFCSCVLTLQALNFSKKIVGFFTGFGISTVTLEFLFIAGLFSNLAAGFSIVLSCIQVIFLAGIIYLLLQDMFSTTIVTEDTILGGVCIYFLIGYLWTLLYFILFRFDPNSFISNPKIGEINFFYFSFITLATVGYGDITPATGQAMLLASLEAIIGQFYMAVLLARLIGLHTMQAPQK